MVRIAAFIFVALNFFPIFWMIWSSFMGNNDIMQGRLFPKPYRSDVYFMRPVEGIGTVAATLNGQIYRYPEESLDASQRESYNFHAVSSNYVLNGKDLYVFSADEALFLFDLEKQKITRKWNWSFFKKSFEKNDFTFFYPIPDEIPDIQWQNLSKQLNEIPLLSTGDTNCTLAGFLSAPFPHNDSLLYSLNFILDNPVLLHRVLSIWEKEPHWMNPVISKLFKKHHRSEVENRELFRWCLSERIPHIITRFRMLKWEDIWVNRLPQSDHGLSIALAGRFLCMGVWWNSFPGVVILDLENPEEFRWITVHHRLPSSAIQNIIPVSDSEVLLSLDYGFTLLDVEKGVLTKNFLFGENGLPSFFGRDLRSERVGRSAILFTYGREIFFFDFRAGKVLKHLLTDETGFYSDITAIHVHHDEVYFGFAGGIVQMTLQDLIYSENIDRKLYPVHLQNRSDSTMIENGVVTSIFVSDHKIWVGTISGRIAIIDKETGELQFNHLPEGDFFLHWRNYQDLWKTIPFKIFLINSLIVCFSSMLIIIIFGTCSAYALTRFRKSSRTFNKAILITQVVPVILYLIPMFLIFAYLQQHFNLSLLNSKIGMVMLYSILFLPMTIWILKGFFLAIPKEQEEAALIDGCSRIKAFFKVTLPSVFPGIVATGIYVFLLAWDELMISWVLSSDISSATIPVGIRLYAGQFGSRFDLLMAAATLSTLPLLFLFFLIHRQIFYGISGSSPKNQKKEQN